MNNLTVNGGEIFSFLLYFPFPFPVSESSVAFQGAKNLVAFWGVKNSCCDLGGLNFPCVPRGYKILLRSRGVKLNALSLASMGDYSALLTLIANQGGYFLTQSNKRDDSHG